MCMDSESQAGAAKSYRLVEYLSLADALARLLLRHLELKLPYRSSFGSIRLARSIRWRSML